jgi:hypothetical protein
MNSNDYYRAVLLGVIVGMGFLSLFMVINPGEDVKEPVASKSNFEVVDRYQDRCDVVRYTDSSMATYKYFLDCKDR